MRWILAATAATSITVAGVGGGFAVAHRAVGEAALAGASGRASETVASVAPPQSARVVEETTYVGVLVPPQAVNVAPRQGGKLSLVSVQVGAVVRAGDLLAQVDDSVLKHELAMAQASARVAGATAMGARVDLAGAREKSNRRAATVQIGGRAVPIVSGEEASSSRLEERSSGARAASAGANVSVAGARVRQLAAELAQLSLRAPFDGVVAARFADPGAFLQAGEPAVRVIGSGGMRIRFAVPEEHALRVRVDARIEAAADDRVVAGVVERISPEVEASSRTVFVEARVDERTCGSECTALASRVVRVRLPAASQMKLAAHNGSESRRK